LTRIATPFAIDCVRELKVGGRNFRYFSLPAAAQDPALSGLTRLPFSQRILAENLLRNANTPEVKP
jgi:aconitase A